jgi:hypothetical protein
LAISQVFIEQDGGPQLIITMPRLGGALALRSQLEPVVESSEKLFRYACKKFADERGDDGSLPAPPPIPSLPPPPPSATLPDPNSAATVNPLISGPKWDEAMGLSADFAVDSAADHFLWGF